MSSSPQYMKEYWKKNREHLREVQRIWVAKNRQHIREYRRAYRASMSLEQKAKIRQSRNQLHNDRRLRALQILGGVCYGCGRANDNRRGRSLHIHHLTYRNGNPYKETRGREATVRTVREVFRDPENFVLLCYRCHIIIENYSPEQLLRFIHLIEKKSVMAATEVLVVDATI